MWWVFLVNGVVWLFVSGVVLRFTDTSITTVGVIMGVVLVLAGATGLWRSPRWTTPAGSSSVFASSARNLRGAFAVS
ncbi:MAG TPA: hypothetical protein VN180_14095 [Acidimicrobiia bacterium]|nr:hypothetical protein [Acidimicrobiia bacterium]